MSLICPHCKKDLEKIGIIAYTSVEYSSTFDGGYFELERDGEDYDYSVCASCYEDITDFLDEEGIGMLWPDGDPRYSED